MRRILSMSLILAVSIVATRHANGDEAVSYWREIAPIFKKNCVACHREGQAEGGLSLETPDALISGGDSGTLFDLEQSSESLIFVRVTDEDDIMPPDDNSVGAKRLKESELSLLKRWIEQGAKIDERAKEELGWQPIPETIRSSYTLAISPDDSVVAVAHANRVEVSDAATGAVIQKLSDEALPFPGIADYDFVQAMAFSPNGDRIATGGFRTVRIWKRWSVPATPSNWSSVAAGPVAFSPDDTQAILVNSVGDLEVWSLADDSRTRVLSPVQGRVITLTWPTPTHCLVGLDNGTLARIQVADGSVVNQVLLGQAPVEFATHDAKIIVVRTADGKVAWLKDFVEVEQDSLQEVADATAIIALTPSSPLIAIARKNGQLLLVDANSCAVKKKITHGASISAIAAHPTAAQVVTAGADGVARLWNLADGKLVREFSGDPVANLRHARAQRDSAREESWLKQLESQRDALKKALEKEEAALKTVTEARDKAKTALEEQTAKVTEAAKTVSATEQKIAAAKKRMESSKVDVDTTTKLVATSRDQFEEADGRRHAT